MDSVQISMPCSFVPLVQRPSLAEALSTLSCDTVREVVENLRLSLPEEVVQTLALRVLLEYGEAYHVDLLHKAGIDLERGLAENLRCSFACGATIEPTERHRNILSRLIRPLRHTVPAMPDLVKILLAIDDSGNSFYDWLCVFATQVPLESTEIVLLTFAGDYRMANLFEKLLNERSITQRVISRIECPRTLQHFKLMAMDLLGSLCLLRHDIPAATRIWQRYVDICAQDGIRRTSSLKPENLSIQSFSEMLESDPDQRLAQRAVLVIKETWLLWKPYLTLFKSSVSILTRLMSSARGRLAILPAMMTYEAEEGWRFRPASIEFARSTHIEDRHDQMNPRTSVYDVSLEDIRQLVERIIAGRWNYSSSPTASLRRSCITVYDNLTVEILQILNQKINLFETAAVEIHETPFCLR